MYTYFYSQVCLGFIYFFFFQFSHDFCKYFIFSHNFIWATSCQNLLLPYANNKDTDQPAHQRILHSTFVVYYLDSMIPLVSISVISSLYLASLAVQAGLCLTRSQTLKRFFSWWGSYSNMMTNFARMQTACLLPLSICGSCLNFNLKINDLTRCYMHSFTF